MGAFIDRNPELMMQYAKNAGSIIDEMTTIIRKTEALLNSYAKDLDDPTQKQLEELHKCCSTFFKQIETYKKVADDVFLKGIRLKDVRDGG